MPATKPNIESVKGCGDCERNHSWIPIAINNIYVMSRQAGAKKSQVPRQVCDIL